MRFSLVELGLSRKEEHSVCAHYVCPYPLFFSLFRPQALSLTFFFVLCLGTVFGQKRKETLSLSLWRCKFIATALAGPWGISEGVQWVDGGGVWSKGVLNSE